MTTNRINRPKKPSVRSVSASGRSTYLCGGDTDRSEEPVFR